jgi:hypothetical protein
MMTVVTHRAAPMPRRPAWLDGKPTRRLLNGQGIASAAPPTRALARKSVGEGQEHGTERGKR